MVTGYWEVVIGAGFMEVVMDAVVMRAGVMRAGVMRAGVIVNSNGDRRNWK